jgi:uncharacterized protein (DUF1684 family)
MKYLILIICFATHSLFAQNFTKEIAKHRALYKNEFLTDKNSPLKKEDLKFLQFYAANPSYKVKTYFTKTIDTTGFDMLTHSGKIKKYYVFGFVTFTLKKQVFKLFIYQSEQLKTTKGLEDYLFIPFTDETNSTATFGGGRYLDFKEKDIVNNQLLIDFNKCYNPYCAYKGGYNCPIPPKENDLKITIEAGEKLFLKTVQE